MGSPEYTEDSHTLFNPPDTSEKCPQDCYPPLHPFRPLMRVLSPFSLSIPWLAQPEPCFKPKFTLEEQDSDPSSASTSPDYADADLKFIPALSSISDSAMLATGRPPRRRWTLAMAMTDEGVTDEALVKVLERIRLQPKHSETSEDKSTAVWDVDQDTWNWNFQWEDNVDGTNCATEIDKIPYTSSLPSLPRQHSLSDPTSPLTKTPWKTARQALLTCRELVRTERHYLSSLTRLIASETATVPPPLMIHYASHLASISKRYLASMEADPGAVGVCAAFLGLEDVLGSAYVSWCGIVGGWFETNGSPSSSNSGGSSPMRRLSKGRSEEDIPVFGASSLRRSFSKRRDVPTMTSLNSSPSLSPVSPTPSFKMLSWRKDKDRSNSTNKPPLRDLAILPTQRIVRYALLYRNLLAHTPSASPSRALVERASEAATRVAQKCDRAQDNAAFLVKPPIKSSFPPTRSSTTPKSQHTDPKTVLPRSRKTSAG